MLYFSRSVAIDSRSAHGPADLLFLLLQRLVDRRDIIIILLLYTYIMYTALQYTSLARRKSWYNVIVYTLYTLVRSPLARGKYKYKIYII